MAATSYQCCTSSRAEAFPKQFRMCAMQTASCSSGACPALAAPCLCFDIPPGNSNFTCGQEARSCSPARYPSQLLPVGKSAPFRDCRRCQRGGWERCTAYCSLWCARASAVPRAPRAGSLAPGVQRKLPGGGHVRHQLRALHALRRLRLLPLLPGRAAGRHQLHLRAAGARHMQQASTQLHLAVGSISVLEPGSRQHDAIYLTDCRLARNAAAQIHAGVPVLASPYPSHARIRQGMTLRRWQSTCAWQSLAHAVCRACCWREMLSERRHAFYQQ